MAKEPRKQGEFWFTPDDAARVFAVTVRQFYREFAPLATPDDVRHVPTPKGVLGRPRAFYFLRGLIEAVVAKRTGTAAVPNPGGQGPTNSPTLEERRRIQNEILRIDLATKRGELITLADVHARFIRLAAVLRATSEELSKKCGPVARELFERRLDEWNAAEGREFGKATGSNGDGN